jgi:hypothetical protein
METKLIKYMELTKLVREYSSDKTLLHVSKIAKAIMNEVMCLHSYTDFMNQVDIAKGLFIQNPEKYYDPIYKPNIHIII